MRKKHVYSNEPFPRCQGVQAAFAQVWLSRDTHLDKVPGFVEFRLDRTLRLPTPSYIRQLGRAKSGFGAVEFRWGSYFKTDFVLACC